MNYLKISQIPGFIISLLTTLFMVFVISFFFRKFSEEINLLTSNRKSQFVAGVRVFLIPVIIGTILTIPFRIMPLEQAAMPFMSALVWLPWIMAFPSTRRAAGNSRAEKRTSRHALHRRRRLAGLRCNRRLRSTHLARMGRFSNFQGSTHVPEL